MCSRATRMRFCGKEIWRRSFGSGSTRASAQANTLKAIVCNHKRQFVFEYPNNSLQSTKAHTADAGESKSEVMMMISMRLQINYETKLNERPEYLTAFDYQNSRALAVLKIIFCIFLPVGWTVAERKFKKWEMYLIINIPKLHHNYERSNGIRIM